MILYHYIKQFPDFWNSIKDDIDWVYCIKCSDGKSHKLWLAWFKAYVILKNLAGYYVGYVQGTYIGLKVRLGLMTREAAEEYAANLTK